jgi:hypothetical protein
MKKLKIIARSFLIIREASLTITRRFHLLINMEKAAQERKNRPKKAHHLESIEF